MSASSGLSHNQPVKIKDTAVKIKDAAVKIKGAAMKAVILSGKPATRAAITDLLSISDIVPVPEVKGDQVLVRVRATALNIEDIMNGVGRRIGTSITATKEAPVVLGQEFSGVVERG